MQGGDIDNSTAPTVLVVAEGLVFQDQKPKETKKLLDKKKYTEAAENFHPNGQAAYALQHLWQFRNLNVRLVTFLPEAVIEVFDRKMQEEWTFLSFAIDRYDPVDLGRRMTFDRSILLVVDCDPSRTMLYPAGRSRIVNPAYPQDIANIS